MMAQHKTKHQIPNTKLQRNPKLQIPKPVAGSLSWSLGLGGSLEFGALIGGRISPLPDPLPTSPSWGEGIDRGLGGGIKMRLLRGPCSFRLIRICPNRRRPRESLVLVVVLVLVIGNGAFEDEDEKEDEDEAVCTCSAIHTPGRC
jgi:hypothetical protein